MLGEWLKKQDVQALRAKNRFVMIAYALGLLLSPIGFLKVLIAYGSAPAFAVGAGIVLSLPIAIFSLRKSDEPSDRLIATLLAALGLPIIALLCWRFFNDLAHGQIDMSPYRTWRRAIGGPCLLLGMMWLYWHELKRFSRSRSSLSQTVR
ncbi:MAG: hypothetical protein QM647_10755 [Asticcacaulis sp.]|uniref:hypothetical protein n=1 Tax=Asticcacaulis sp. TaxID=1872648 RepID=UPI0039E66706